MNRFLVIAGLGNILIAAALVAGLLIARGSATKNFATTDARRAWDEWRSDAASQQDEELPVQRCPRSQKPPTLVLLRDHFVVCIAAGLSLTTVLYWTIALFVRGMLAGPEFHVEYTTSHDVRIK